MQRCMKNLSPRKVDSLKNAIPNRRVVEITVASALELVKEQGELDGSREDSIANIVAGYIRRRQGEDLAVYYLSGSDDRTGEEGLTVAQLLRGSTLDNAIVCDVCPGPSVNKLRSIDGEEIDFSTSGHLIIVDKLKAKENLIEVETFDTLLCLDKIAEKYMMYLLEYTTPADQLNMYHVLVQIGFLQGMVTYRPGTTIVLLSEEASEATKENLKKGIQIKP